MIIKYHEYVTDEQTGEGRYVLKEREATPEEISRFEEMKTPKSAERIASLKRLLAESDYKAIKYAEGFIPEDEYAPIKAQRQAWRDEINRLEEKVWKEDHDRAPAEVRAIRDKMLTDSYKEMVLDSIGLEVPTVVSFTAWLDFLKKLGMAVSGEMARYRQGLRDIPKQEGFPYSVVFPTITRHEQ